MATFVYFSILMHVAIGIMIHMLRARYHFAGANDVCPAAREVMRIQMMRFRLEESRQIGT